MFQKINNFFSSKKNSKLINEISGKYLEKVNLLENEIRELSQEQLIKKLFDLKESYVQDKKKELDEKDLCIISAITREVSDRSIGTYYYRKRLSKNDFLTCAVKVFALHVKARKKKFPERGERKSKWVNPTTAMDLVTEPELKTVIKNFAARIKKESVS